MSHPADQYFLSRAEPDSSCMQYLRALILRRDPGISETWKYGMPFYCYRGKMLCYLWVHKKFRQPYIGFVNGNLLNHPDLLQEKRARMKILIVNPGKDIPVAKINKLLSSAIAVSPE